jgi:hypothetical protein
VPGRVLSGSNLQLARRKEHGMISHDHRCIFANVPKTASKSVRYLFGLPELGCDYEANARNIEYPYGHRRLLEFVNEKYFLEYFKFTFVRNPFDRIVSAFFI